MDLPGDELRVAVLRLARRMRLERADGDVTDGQLSLLFILIKEGPLTISALSDRERISPPSINRTVNGLEQLGLVRRSSSPDDGRLVLISATDAGVAIVGETRRRRAEWLGDRLSTLTAEQRQLLAEAAPLLRELADT